MPAEQANRQALREILPAEDAVLPPMPPPLAGRRGSEAAMLRWVAGNLDNPRPDPATCPDGGAWAILRQCRADPATRLEFIGSLWARLVRPAEAEAAPEVQADGDTRADTLARLRALAESIRSRE